MQVLNSFVKNACSITFLCDCRAHLKSYASFGVFMAVWHSIQDSSFASNLFSFSCCLQKAVKSSWNACWRFKSICSRMSQLITGEDRLKSCKKSSHGAFTFLWTSSGWHALSSYFTTREECGAACAETGPLVNSCQVCFTWEKCAHTAMLLATQKWFVKWGIRFCFFLLASNFDAVHELSCSLP